ncbi:MAG TPA: hypothetical protein VG964_00280 [Candidatus Saccharimonadales bacterium]|nr:hypothetical protein [Candidatus Saccharimonadales bacterium]
MAKSVSPNQMNLLEEPGSDDVHAPSGLSEVEQGVAIDVEDRARSLLLAVNALDGVAKRRGLVKAVDRIPGKREELRGQYASRPLEDGKRANTEQTFDESVLPGAIEIGKDRLKSAEELFNEAFGDYEAAKEAALSQFSPQERAELEISGQYPDREEFQASFKAKMLDSTKIGDPYKIKKRPTRGSLNRKKLRGQMSETLKRTYNSRTDQAA